MAEVISAVRTEWLAEPEQVAAFEELVAEHGTRDNARRTMASRWRSMLRDHYGGVLWFQVLISTGTIPHRMLELANVQLGQKSLQKKKAPASSRRPASGGAPTGSQHRVSAAKRQRQQAKKLIKAVREEAERRSYYRRKMSDADFDRLQADAKRAEKKAIEMSEASGHPYKLNGQAPGCPETSNFSILLADFCGEFHINVATGYKCSEDRPATLCKR